MKKLFLFGLAISLLSSCKDDITDLDHLTLIKLEVNIEGIEDIPFSDYKNFTDNGPDESQNNSYNNEQNIFIPWFPSGPGYYYYGTGGQTSNSLTWGNSVKVQYANCGGYGWEPQRKFFIEVFNQANESIGTFDYFYKSDPSKPADFKNNDILHPIVNCYPVKKKGEKLRIVINYRTEEKLKKYDGESFIAFDNIYKSFRFNNEKEFSIPNLGDTIDNYGVNISNLEFIGEVNECN